MREQLFSMSVDPFDDGWTIIDLQDVEPISTSEEEWVNHSFRMEIKYKELSKVCECGAESCGFPKHSDYCPKYEK